MQGGWGIRECTGVYIERKGVAACRADLTLLSTCRSELLYLLSAASPAAQPLPSKHRNGKLSPTKRSLACR